MSFDERVKEVFERYIKVICPYVLQYEILDSNFPIEILNEIRAAFTHFAKLNLSDDTTVKEKNLIKIEGHIKRANLDCYKYLCTAFEDKYKEFERQYKGVDLSLVDNGDFLQKLVVLRNDSINELLNARKSDLEINADDILSVDEVYSKYETAFNNYSATYKLITDSFPNIEKIKRKAQVKNYVALGSFVVGVASLILAVILKLCP